MVILNGLFGILIVALVWLMCEDVLNAIEEELTRYADRREEN